MEQVHPYARRDGVKLVQKIGRKGETGVDLVPYMDSMAEEIGIQLDPSENENVVTFAFHTLLWRHDTRPMEEWYAKALRAGGRD